MTIQELWYGDCLELMKKIPDKSVDMILCDLPYGTTNCSWDSIIDLNLLWKQYNRIAKENAAIVLFAQTPFDKILGCSNLKNLRYEIIWEKTAATGHLNAKKMPMKAHENILIFYKKLPTYNPQKTEGHKAVNSYTKFIETQNRGEIYNSATAEVKGGGNTDRYPRSVIKFPKDNRKESYHPTQKPLALCEWLIKTYSNEGDVILDNCCGSGTTLVAAKKLNRQFYGIELEEYYIEISAKRLRSTIQQLAINQLL